MKGKVCIVTGSSSGIGQATAILLASRGAAVTLCGRNQARLEAAKQKCIQASGGDSKRFLGVQGDLNQGSVRREVVQRTVEKFQRLDCLIANAGIMSDADSIDNCTEDTFDNIISTNVKSVFFLIQAAVPELAKNKGNIVVVSSILSSIPYSPGAVYAMSKASIDHMVRCLALDLAPRGIRVNSINPSYCSTGILGAGPTDAGAESKEGKGVDMFEQLEKPFQPLGNRIVTAEELAEGMLFLASDAASFVTGQHLQVDGGRAIRGPIVSPMSPVFIK